MPPSSELTNPLRREVERPARRHAPVVVVLDADAVDRLGDLLRRVCRGVELDVISAHELARSNSWEMQHRVRFVLVEQGTDARPWRSTVDVAAVRGIPVALLAPSGLSEEQREVARKAGVSVVVKGISEDARTFLELLQSPQWLASRLERVPIADTLQLLSASNHKGLLVLLCPHSPPFTPVPWAETATRCRGDEACRGAVARVYIHDGRPVHAETASAEGLAALAECLEFGSGIARFHEVYLPSERETIQGSMSEVILQAAFSTDESVRLAGYDESLDPYETADVDMSTPSPDHPRSSAPTVPEQLQDVLEKTRVVVHADGQGALHDAVGVEEGDGVAAVAAMMNQAFDAATHALGLGATEGWTVVAEESSCVAASRGGDIAAATLAAPRDAFRQLDRFVQRAQEVLEGQEDV